MKAQLGNVDIFITFPKSSPDRGTITVWVNTTHKNWGVSNGGSIYFNREETDFINNAVDKACELAKTLEEMGK